MVEIEKRTRLAAKKLDDHSDWTASMTCARTWLSECLQSHPRCQVPCSSKPTAYRPTRLIEIGQPEPHKLRVRLSSELDDDVSPYATLSHCWGNSKALRLTSITTHELSTGIAISKLAKTFQDAVFTAQSLDIKFLWIDSLCILQDSTEDWQRESALMSHVYRYGLINIAASVAADSDAGFFS
jgi:hypothetical protein